MTNRCLPLLVTCAPAATRWASARSPSSRCCARWAAAARGWARRRQRQRCERLRSRCAALRAQGASPLCLPARLFLAAQSTPRPPLSRSSSPPSFFTLQLRLYAPYLAAEVTLRGGDMQMRDALSQGFRSIAGFIFGARCAARLCSSVRCMGGWPWHAACVQRRRELTAPVPPRAGHPCTPALSARLQARTWWPRARGPPRWP